jgi:hypothetical protein
MTLETSREAWAYSAVVVLDPAGELRGAVDLRIKLTVHTGRLGAAVLWRDSSTKFIAPEVTVEPGVEPVELVIHLPEIREAGQLVLRSWADGGTTANIASISLHKAAGA